MEVECATLSSLDCYRLFQDERRDPQDIADEFGLPIDYVDALIEQGRVATAKGTWAEFACRIKPLDFVSVTRNGQEVIMLITRVEHLRINAANTYTRLITDYGAMYLVQDFRVIPLPYKKTPVDQLPLEWQARYRKAAARIGKVDT